MAIEEDEDDNENEEKKKGKGSIVTKILLFGILPLMTAVILVVGGLFVAGVIPGDSGGSQSSEAEEGGEDGEEDVEGEEDGEDEGEEGEEGDEDEEHQAAVYIPVDPAFVVNFASQGKARFLQVTVEVMTRDAGVTEKINLHMPVIRNNLMLLLSSQSYDDVSTLEGKESLREEALEVIQEILEEETGDPGIEAVYFTSFVMQ